MHRSSECMQSLLPKMAIALTLYIALLYEKAPARTKLTVTLLTVTKASCILLFAISDLTENFKVLMQTR